MIENKEDKILDELMLEEGQTREVLGEFGLGGRFKVYSPNEDFRLLMEELIEKSKEEGEYTLTDNDSLRVMFSVLTNFPEDFPNLLEKEKFDKICENPKRVFSKMSILIAEIVNDEINQINKDLTRMNNMPNSAKARLIKKFKEDKENRNNK